MRVRNYILIPALAFLATAALAQAPAPAPAPAPQRSDAVQPAPATPGGQAAAATGTAAVTPSTTPTTNAPQEFSYGKSNLSILFLPVQIDRMKNSIRTFESSDRVNVDQQEVVTPPVDAGFQQIEEKLNEPAAYPVFYLASIAYDTPGDWSIWISGHKITSRRNETDMNVLSVSRESVTFQWKPDFTNALLRRNSDELFAPTDAVKNKLAATQTASIDEQTGITTFTLRPNQTFSPGYFRVFEGFVDAPKDLPPISTTINAGNGGGRVGIPPVGPGGQPMQLPTGRGPAPPLSAMQPRLPSLGAPTTALPTAQR